MLRSLFSGVSGLKNEQAEMDVIANNISNSTTTGFKSSRVTFADSLSETLSGASGTSGNFGGANPIQIGRGAQISSIDTNFKQGSLNTTGISTDLALNGSGFLVVTNGTQRFYTRAGALQIQEDGTVMAQGGTNNIMGRLADDDGNLTSTTAIEEIKLPFGKKDPAKATTEIEMYCNLDRNASKVEEWITGDGLKTDDGEAALGTTRLDQVEDSEIHLGDQIVISGTDKDGNDITETTFTYGDDGLSINDLIAKINEAYNSSDAENGATASIDKNGNIRLKANRAGENDLSITLDSPATNHSATTESHSSDQYTVGGFAVSTSTRLLDMDDNITGGGVVLSDSYSVGDTFTISGTNPDGTAVSFDFEFEDGTETMQDLLDAMNTNFSGVNADLVNGQIVVTDTAPGYSETYVSIADGAGTGMGSLFSTETFTSSSTWTTGGGAANAVGTDTLDSIDGLNYVANDVINLTATKASGETITSSFQITDPATDTLDDVITQFNNTFTTAGVTASLSNGKIVLSDSVGGDEHNYTSFRIYDAQENSGTGGFQSNFTSPNVGTNKSSLNLPAFTNKTEGSTGVHEASITVYDSMGEEHVLDVKYTQNPDLSANEWSWEATIDGGSLGEENIIGGTTGTVTFKDDGSLKEFSFDGDYDKMIFQPEGAQRMEIDFNAGNSGQFDGMTQMASASTTIAREQNGHSLGVLNDVNIDDQGKITGIYSNGVSKTLAQVAVANFTNEAGLQKEGNSLFSANEATGNPIIGWAGTNNKTQIKSGYLESSNVDLTDEFSKMIIAQRAMQASAKVVSTSDQILQTIIRQLKRG